LRVLLSLVFAALRDAMPVFAQAAVFRALIADSGREAVIMLLLTKRQTSRINRTIQLCCVRAEGKARAQNHNQQEGKKRKVTKVDSHKYSSWDKLG
jgi:hypothetical protein